MGPVASLSVSTTVLSLFVVFVFRWLCVFVACYPKGTRLLSGDEKVGPFVFGLRAPRFAGVCGATPAPGTKHLGSNWIVSG